MIAHSLRSEVFGPARNLHGATYVVDVTFSSHHLNEYNVVIDIGQALKIVGQCLDTLRYCNLDELPQFTNKFTTTEFLAGYIHQLIKEKVNQFFSGTIKVCLGESHIARASYES
jgi:6-pyruvoyl-tetrahydropterin synthase